MTNSLTLKFRQIRSFASFSSFDTLTEEGRSNERQRRIFLSAVSSVVYKVVSMGTMLVSIPLTLHYLGIERFGLWMTISSVIAMLSFADLGIGNGLLNAISEANGKDDHAAIGRYISSAFAILSGIALVILLVFSLIYSFVPWAHFFNVKSHLAMEESGIAVAVFMLCFALNIPAGIVQRTQMGLQMGFVANIWQAGGSIIGLIAVLLAIHFEMSLPWLVGGMAGAPVVVAFLNGMFFFARTGPEFKPQLASISRIAMKRIARTGLLFLVLQIACSIVVASDNIVISRILGAEAVTQYAVTQKLFSVIPILLGMALTPLWPAYGEAIARGDGQWVKKLFIKSLLLALVFSSTLSAAMVIFPSEILSLWVGHAVHPSLLLLLGFGLWKVTEACSNAFAMLLNGANIVGIQVIVAVLLIASAVPLKILLVQDLGVAGAVWATFVCFFLFDLLPYTFLAPRILRRVSNR